MWTQFRLSALCRHTQFRLSALCSPQNLISLINMNCVLWNGCEPSWVFTIMCENNTDVYTVIWPSNGGDLDFIGKVPTVGTPQLRQSEKCRLSPKIFSHSHKKKSSKKWWSIKKISDSLFSKTEGIPRLRGYCLTPSYQGATYRSHNFKIMRI